MEPDIYQLLLKLSEDLSSIKTAVSTLENQMDKLDSRIVTPFQEWLHAVKVHEKELDLIKTDLALIHTQIIANQDQIKIVDEHVKSAKWYTAGVLGTICFVGVIVYNIVKMLLPFLH